MATRSQNKVTVDGYTFDSKDEAFYYEALKKRMEKGEILNFEVKPDKFTLVPTFKDNEGVTVKSMTYEVDFRVYHLDGSEELIEVKGWMEEDAALKIKLLRYAMRNDPTRFTIVSRHLTHARTHGDEYGFIRYEVLNRIKAKEAKVKKALKDANPEFPGIIKEEKKKRVKRRGFR